MEDFSDLKGKFDIKTSIMLNDPNILASVKRLELTVIGQKTIPSKDLQAAILNGWKVHEKTTYPVLYWKGTKERKNKLVGKKYIDKFYSQTEIDESGDPFNDKNSQIDYRIFLKDKKIKPITQTVKREKELPSVCIVPDNALNVELITVCRCISDNNIRILDFHDDDIDFLAIAVDKGGANIPIFEHDIFAGPMQKKIQPDIKSSIKTFSEYTSSFEIPGGIVYTLFVPNK